MKCNQMHHRMSTSVHDFQLFLLIGDLIFCRERLKKLQALVEAKNDALKRYQEHLGEKMNNVKTKNLERIGKAKPRQELIRRNEDE